MYVCVCVCVRMVPEAHTGNGDCSVYAEVILTHHRDHMHPDQAEFSVGADGNHFKQNTLHTV